MKITDDLAVGDTILYPTQQPDGACRNESRTVSGIVEYPATRVLYFREGGFGVADRGIEHATAAGAR